MKTVLSLIVITSLLSSFAKAQAPVITTSAAKEDEKNNLLQNPGFESGEQVEIATVYPRLTELGTELIAQGDGQMPEGVILDESDHYGWPVSEGNGMEYIKGEPGQEVHTGKHAIKVISRNGYSPLIIASHLSPKGFIRLPERTEDDDQPKLYRFSLFAKGFGKVTPVSYCYDNEFLNIYATEAEPLIAVEPESVEVESADQWTKFEGTIKILPRRVNALYFVIKVEGEVWLDDVTLVDQENP